MTYHSPELHELGFAEDIILGPTGEGSDMHAMYPPAFTLQDFDE